MASENPFKGHKLLVAGETKPGMKPLGANPTDAEREAHAKYSAELAQKAIASMKAAYEARPKVPPAKKAGAQPGNVVPLGAQAGPEPEATAKPHLAEPEPEPERAEGDVGAEGEAEPEPSAGIGKGPDVFPSDHHGIADQPAALAFLNRQHAIIDSVGGKSCIASRSTNEFGQPTIIFQSTESITLRYRNRRVRYQGMDADGNPVIKLKEVPKWWLDHAERRQYSGVTFAPGVGMDVDRKLNLWQGWGVKEWAGDWSRMRWHIEHIFVGAIGRCSSTSSAGSPMASSIQQSEPKWR
jgi:hypothetical protein